MRVGGLQLLSSLAVFSPRPAVHRLPSPICDAASLADIDEPKLESDCSFDFIPLLTALKTGDFLEADQLTRDGLIKLAGEAAVKRGFVYFGEVPNLPAKDLATIERLWLAYSDGKFGYTVQAEILKTKRVGGDLEKLYDRIGWKNEDGSLRRWLPDKGNEFIYDLEEAPAGHLPLTNTLRGTLLLSKLLEHSVWESDEFSGDK